MRVMPMGPREVSTVFRQLRAYLNESMINRLVSGFPDMFVATTKGWIDYSENRNSDITAA